MLSIFQRKKNMRYRTCNTNFLLPWLSKQQVYILAIEKLTFMFCKKLILRSVILQCGSMCLDVGSVGAYHNYLCFEETIIISFVLYLNRPLLLKFRTRSKTSSGSKPL